MAVFSGVILNPIFFTIFALLYALIKNGEKTALFVHFLYKNDNIHFTKTGSVQT